MSFGRILEEILEGHGITPYMTSPQRRGQGKKRDLSGIYKAIGGKILRPQCPTILDWMGSIDASHAEEVVALGARLMAIVEEEVCEIALYLLYALSPADDRAGLLADAAQRAGMSLDAIRDRMPEARRQHMDDPVMQVYIAAARSTYERPQKQEWQEDSVAAWRYEQEFAGRLHAVRDALARLLIRRVVWDGPNRAFAVEWTETAGALLRRAGVEMIEGQSYRLDPEALHLRLAPPLSVEPHE
jgi:hypothetical protein